MIPRLDAVEYHFGTERVRPFDPRADYFRQRVELDRARLTDVLVAVERLSAGNRVLDVAATPYILSSALVARGCEVTLTALPFEGRQEGVTVLTVEGREYSCPLFLVDAEEPLPFADAAFDVVVAGEIFEHLYRRPWHLLAEAWRCLTDRGLLVMTTPNAESLERLYVWLRRLPSSQGFNPEAPTARHAREYTPTELEAVLESQGFSVIDLRTPNYASVADGFGGALGAVKRSVYRGAKKLASHSNGPLGRRGDAILAVARKVPHRRPGPPPGFMVYALGDERSGYNFPEGVSETLEPRDVASGNHD